jgi:hypothetical protein
MVAVPKNNAKREWRGTKRVAMSQQERDLVGKRLRRKRDARLAARVAREKNSPAK